MLVDNPQFWLYLIIALVSTFVALKWENWIVKFISFLVAFGSFGALAVIANFDVRVVLVFNTFLFLATGITSIRVKHVGNRILGIVLTILGVVAALLTLNAFGASPGTFLGAVALSIQQGWEGLVAFVTQHLGLA